MQKNIRRKNLAFRPAGEDPLHDKAVCFMDQIGRGQSDFVASAVVYYAMMLAEGKIEKELAKQLNAHRIRAKILTAPTLPNPNTYSGKDVKTKEAPLIMKQTKATVVRPEEPEAYEKKNGDGIFNAQPPDDPVNPIDSQESVSSPLPDDMVKSLLNGFRIR